MDTLPGISIIGPGKVGTALGALAARAGWPVVAVAGGGPGKAEAAAELIGSDAAACTPADAAGAGGLVLLTVPDESIETLCGELADAAAFSPGAIVAHCCGALPSEVLRAARDCCGCLIGSLHPLQTFPTVQSAIRNLPGAWCFCEGNSAAVEVLEQLAEAIGARPARIDPAGKSAYHAAAAMACNYLVALLDAAAAVAEAAGVDRRMWLTASGPIVRATVDNVLRLGPADALTGPIARGDVATVRRQAEALAAQGVEVRRLFAAAGRYATELALRKGTLDAAAARAIRQALDRLAEQE